MYDFAFLNILSQDKRGPLYERFSKNRMGALFFSPRLQRLFRLSSLDVNACNIELPLGPHNINDLSPILQHHIHKMTNRLVEHYSLPVLACDRRLRPYFVANPPDFEVIFGDNFIMALASFLIEVSISRHELERIILVGGAADCAPILKCISRLGLPIIVQNLKPAASEAMLYHLLYEQGIAISTDVFKPRQWQRHDLVVFFDPELALMADNSNCGFCIKLYDNSSNLAPGLEQELDSYHLEHQMHHLAPILETGLLLKAGFFSSDTETNKFEVASHVDYGIIQNLGENFGLWDYFLDRVW